MKTRFLWFECTGCGRRAKIAVWTKPHEVGAGKSTTYIRCLFCTARDTARKVELKEGVENA